MIGIVLYLTGYVMLLWVGRYIAMRVKEGGAKE